MATRTKDSETTRALVAELLEVSNYGSPGDPAAVRRAQAAVQRWGVDGTRRAIASRRARAARAQGDPLPPVRADRRRQAFPALPADVSDAPEAVAKLIVEDGRLAANLDQAREVLDGARTKLDQARERQRDAEASAARASKAAPKASGVDKADQDVSGAVRHLEALTEARRKVRDELAAAIVAAGADWIGRLDAAEVELRGRFADPLGEVLKLLDRLEALKGQRRWIREAGQVTLRPVKVESEDVRAHGNHADVRRIVKALTAELTTVPEPPPEPTPVADDSGFAAGVKQTAGAMRERFDA